MATMTNAKLKAQTQWGGVTVKILFKFSHSCHFTFKWP